MGIEPDKKKRKIRGRPIQKMDPDSIWADRRLAAQWTRLSLDMIDKLLQEETFTRHDNGFLLISPLFDYVWRQVEKEKVRSKKAEETASQNSALEQYRRHKADLLKLQLDQLNGALLEAEDVSARATTAGQLLRSLCTEMISRLPDLLAAQTVREIARTLQTEFDKTCTTLGTELEKVYKP